MRKCALYMHLVLALLGVIFAISGSVVFLLYHNFTAAIWTALSGIFAAICLHLHLLVWKARLETYYAPESLRSLSELGFVVSCISSAFCCWYIFATIYWHIPMMPISSSTTISAVWAFMTTKWGVSLWWAAKKYRLHLVLGFPLLINESNASESQVGV